MKFAGPQSISVSTGKASDHITLEACRSSAAAFFVPAGQLTASAQTVGHATQPATCQRCRRVALPGRIP
jgi:hypothetical protein